MNGKEFWFLFLCRAPEGRPWVTGVSYRAGIGTKVRQLCLMDWTFYNRDGIRRQWSCSLGIFQVVGDFWLE